MSEWKKRWQVMANALTNARAIEQGNRSSALRVDIAGCRVAPPPVKRQQGAHYIPRAHAAILPPSVLPENLEPTGCQTDQGGNWYVDASAFEAANAIGFEAANAMGRDATDQVAVPQPQRAAFREFFAAALPLADDVLLVPITPAATA